MDRAELRRAQVYGARDALQNPGLPQPPRAGRLLYHFALSTASAVCRAPVAQLDRVTVLDAVGRGFDEPVRSAGEGRRPSAGDPECNEGRGP